MTTDTALTRAIKQIQARKDKILRDCNNDPSESEARDFTIYDMAKTICIKLLDEEHLQILEAYGMALIDENGMVDSDDADRGEKYFVNRYNQTT